jgi:hypothetical protein
MSSIAASTCRFSGSGASLNAIPARPASSRPSAVSDMCSPFLSSGFDFAPSRAGLDQAFFRKSALHQRIKGRERGSLRVRVGDKSLQTSLKASSIPGFRNIFSVGSQPPKVPIASWKPAALSTSQPTIISGSIAGLGRGDSEFSPLNHGRGRGLLDYVRRRHCPLKLDLRIERAHDALAGIHQAIAEGV